MSALEKLTFLFKNFPGIGPRQARRFVYFLLTRNKDYIEELVSLIEEVKKGIKVCDSCRRFFNGNSKSGTCATCNDANRNSELLMIVEKDVDFEAVEKSGGYNGYYFILGGSIPILEKEPEKKIRQKELLKLIEVKLKGQDLKEIIFAFGINAEGENTVFYLTNLLQPIVFDKNIKFTTLGRGLSTGLEVEYSDSETLKNALKNRG
ncbi:MAG: toprim domain-containing protein [Patescibacteria group bacterium]